MRCPDCAAPGGIQGNGAVMPMDHLSTCPLVAALDDVSTGDAAWFALHPGETLRTRLITSPERQMHVIMTGAPPDGPWVLVKQVVPGTHMRSFWTRQELDGRPR